jgi:cobalt-zinc-cadmium efflux system outer membrane protein
MLVRWRAALCAATVLIASQALRARGEGAAGPAEPRVTPRLAAEEALRANPDLRAARAAIDAARGRLVQAGLWPNPELGVAGASDVVFADEGEWSIEVGFAQRFPIAGRLARAREVARLDVEQALAEARDFERTLVAQVESSATALLAVERAIATRDLLIEAARELVRVSSQRFRAAEVSEADLNLLEVDLSRFEQERRLLELERQTETIRLNRLLYRAPEAPVAISGDVEAAAFAPDPAAELTAAALERRPDLRRLRLEVEGARAEARLARAEAWEDWSLEGRYERDRGVIDDAGLELLDPDSLLGLSLRVPLPVWNRNQGRVAEALAAERRAAARLAALERAVEAEVATGLVRVAELARVGREYREDLVPRSERNVALLGRAYRQGLAAISALVQAQQQLADTSLRYVQTLGELRRAEIELEAAAAASPLLTP